MIDDVDFHAAMYDREVVRRILVLREDLVRHDENLAAWHLMSKAVPFFVLDHPVIVEARDAQYEMTKHVIPRDELREADRDADPYEAYYRSNPNELRFEQQYGAEVSEAHRLPRIQYLLDWLGDQEEPFPPGKDVSDQRILDLSANDGFMAARLSIDGYQCDCLDLHPGNVAIARERRAKYPLIGRVEQGSIEADTWRFMPPCNTGAGKRGVCSRGGIGCDVDHVGRRDDCGVHDVVVCFETLEHVRSPRAVLDIMVKLAKPLTGRLFVSVPNGAVENGNLPNWDHVEPKGHVRVFRPEDLRALLEQVGEVEDLQLGVDGVLVARVKPR